VDRLYIDTVYFLQVQDASRSALVHFGLHLMQVFRSKVATEPNPLTDAINPQRQSFSSSKAAHVSAMRLPFSTA
jgi:hypothetical protein